MLEHVVEVIDHWEARATLLPEVELWYGRQVTAGGQAGLQAGLAGGSGLRQVLSGIFHVSVELHLPLSVTDDNSLTSALGHLRHLECASTPLLPGSQLPSVNCGHLSHRR